MAVKIREYTRDDGHIIAVYESGAEYDMTAKHLINAPQTVKITSENAIAMQSRKLEKKRARIEAGALAAVQEKMPNAFTGDDGDWIEAVAQRWHTRHWTNWTQSRSTLPVSCYKRQDSPTNRRRNSVKTT